MYSHFSLPEQITFNKTGKTNIKELVVEPCFPGYGTTLGNALRRVLLSSLSGTAIIAVKIKGASHEFSTIQYIQEDVLEIILNLKNIKFIIHNDTEETVKLSLKAHGEKVVTAKDIELTSDIELATPDAIIANLTDKSAELEMELFIRKGMGYSPTESRSKEKLELGTIAVDAIFTPLLNISFKVENVRVGELTNYDKLVMEIETDGTISPEEAVKEASKILINHFQLLSGEKKPVASEEKEEEKEEKREEAPDVEVRGEKE